MEARIAAGSGVMKGHLEGDTTARSSCTEQLQGVDLKESSGNAINLLDDKKALGLDQFLNKYQSEDDASFNEMLEKYRVAHQQKYAWLQQKERDYAALPSSSNLAITDSSGSRDESRRAVLDSWTYTAKNSLMYIPEGVEYNALELLERSRKTKAIVHSNTRLPGQFVKKLQEGATTSSSGRSKNVGNDKIGVDGRAECAEDSPQVKGYGFMVTPQIQPGMLYWCYLKTCLLYMHVGVVLCLFWSDVNLSSVCGLSYIVPATHLTLWAFMH